MPKRLILNFLFFFLPLSLMSQVFPKEGSQLNYRLTGFSFPAGIGDTKYSIEIAKGTYFDNDSFKRNIIKKVQCRKADTIAEVPFFGTDYTWCVVYSEGHSGVKTSGLHHFRTGMIPESDTNLYRLRVTNQAKEYKDAYIFVDANRTLYDMQGRPVWFLPYIDGNNDIVRDVKMSVKGTITFIKQNDAYEINYDGNVLWKGPNNGRVSGDSQEQYHHEITRLKNGHYMVLGNEQLFMKIPTAEDTVVHFMHWSQIPREKAPKYASTTLGTVIEYDENGKVVWSWKASKFFSGAKKEHYGVPAPGGNIALFLDAHENAFYFDEKNEYLYVSFKNINRILKIRYPDGAVVNEYGIKCEPNVRTDLFCGQHSVSRTSNGYLLAFDNNVCNPAVEPRIVMMQEPVSGSGNLKMLWNFEYPDQEKPLDSRLATGTDLKIRATNGGCVEELSDQTLLSIMPNNDDRIFIVNLNKEILWSAVPEKWNPILKTWDRCDNSYKASIIRDRAALERLIWHGRNERREKQPATKGAYE